LLIKAWKVIVKHLWKEQFPRQAEFTKDKFPYINSYNKEESKKDNRIKNIFHIKRYIYSSKRWYNIETININAVQR
jgi:hypothetical protein